MFVYIDSNYICHTESEKGRPFDVSFFDGKAKGFIEGYRYVPSGEAWTREDDVVFHGEMICPATDYSIAESCQSQYEEDLDTMMPLEEVADLIEEVYNSDLELIEE